MDSIDNKSLLVRVIASQWTLLWRKYVPLGNNELKHGYQNIMAPNSLMLHYSTYKSEVRKVK